VDLFGELNCAVQEATQVDLDGANSVLRDFENRFTLLRDVDSKVSLCAVQYDGEEGQERRIELLLNRDLFEGIRQMRDRYTRDLHLARQFISTEAQPKT